MIGISLAFFLAFQGTSQIQGVVKDATGAVIGGAEVKATQTDTGVARTVISAEDGVYVLPNLAIGPYRVEVSKPGFSTYVQSGIVLQVASNQTVDVTLKVGEVAQEIQVEANAALVDLQGMSVGSVIENARILELPLNGRNPVELIQLAGAAVPAGQAGTAGMPGGRFISIGGGLLSGVSYVLDGTLYNNPFDALNLPFPFPDALQEFKVETSSLTAQNGLHSAGTVSAVVKSGTNSFHGDLFEFFRNGNMNARNANALRRDTLKRNQFGGTIGGPIIASKLFFFAGYQGTRTRSDPADRTGFVPTPRMLAGDFSGCGFPQLRDPATGAVYPNNQIPVSQFSPQALAVVKQLPAAQGPCGETKFGPVLKDNEYQILGRTDYQINNQHSLFVRYMATSFLEAPPFRFSHNILDTVQGFADFLAGPIGGELREVKVGGIAGLDPATLAPSCGNSNLCTDQACSTASDEGDRYVALAGVLGPTKMKLGSICDASFRNTLARFAESLMPSTMPLAGVPADWRMLVVTVTKAGGTVVPCTVAAEGAAQQSTADAIYADPRLGRPAQITFQRACKLDLGDKIDVHVVCAG